MAAISSSNNNNNSGSNIVQQAATNFNPSWMQQTVPSTRSVLPSQNKPVNADETCDPIFAKHSYGREDLLAMRGKDGVKPPVGIEKCPFFVESSLTPVVLLPFTEIEMRLQQNVNSSKALSAFNRTQGHSSNEMNSGGEMTVGGGAWTSTGRSGSGSTSFTAPSRKYQNSDTKVPNRWSALNSSNAGGPPPQRQQSWKNATNGSSGGNLAGGFERPGFREKTGSMNQFERLDSIGNKKNQQESTIGQQTGNDKTTSESVSLDEQKDKGIEHFKQSSATSPKNTSPGHFGTDDFTRHPTTAVISKTNPIETACTVVQPVQQPYKWNYLDPSGVQRGPFDSQQMQAWFASGYFTTSLQVCRLGDSNYQKLGDLFLINGEHTPFISKQTVGQNPTISNPQRPIEQRISPSDLLGAMTASNSTSGPTLGLADVERIWGTTPLEDVGVADTVPKGKIFDNGRTACADTTKSSISTSGFAHSAFSQHLREYELEKTLQTREAQIEEEQQKLREKEEQLRRDEEERSERERKMQEMEAVLKRKQNDLNRIAREKDDEFDKRCQQMAEYERKKREELAALEQRILNEQQRQQLRMEEEDRRRAKELQEILSREKERQRQMLEAESKRKREEEEARMNLAFQAAQHTKELEQEKAKKADDEQRRRFIKEQQRQQQQAFDEAHAERIRQQEIAARAEAAAKAEQQRIKDRYSEQQPIDQQQASKVAWQHIPPVTKPIQMNIVPPVTQQQNSTNKTSSTTSERERRGWQQVQMPKPAPIPPVIGKGSGGTNSCITNQQQQAVGAKKNSQQKKVGDTKTKPPKQQPVVADKFTQWIINRVKELNSSVDAEVFANFIAQIDSPDEAEDYIIGYLGDNKNIKDFHREFLNKRIELRPRVQQPRKDDLSGPAAALTADVAEHSKSASTASVHSKQSGTTTANNAASVKKKKQKQQKVLDPATLGFRAVPDPNRVNAGEIDAVPPAQPGTNRKR